MRFALWAVLVVMFFAPVATLATTPEASPVFSVQKPYLSHAARLVSTIPGDWVPDRSLAHDYAGESGFIASRSLDAFWDLPDPYQTLDEACAGVAERYGGEPVAMTVAEMPACEVEPVATREDAPVFVVITHPQPQGEQEFVLVIANRGALDGILETLSFDLSDVSAELYFDAALDLMSIQSLQRDLVDWDTIRAGAHQRMDNVSPEVRFGVAHEVLAEAVAEIRAMGGDGHNEFLSADGVEQQGDYLTSPDMASVPYVTANLPAPGLVKIVVPGFVGTDEEGTRFVETLWTELEAAVDDTTCGIVVDLGANGGGNMYPMLQGLGPLIGEGPVLGFTDAAGTTSSVTMDNQYQLQQGDLTSTNYTPDVSAPDLDGRSLAVAVLIGSQTISSGEATAIGLMESDFPVRFFGIPTFGLATSRSAIPLIDGSMVLLSDAWTTTVDGQTFPDGVPPDVSVNLRYDPTQVEEWIRETAGC